MYIVRRSPARTAVAVVSPATGLGPRWPATRHSIGVRGPSPMGCLPIRDSQLSLSLEPGQGLAVLPVSTGPCGGAVAERLTAEGE